MVISFDSSWHSRSSLMRNPIHRPHRKRGSGIDSPLIGSPVTRKVTAVWSRAFRKAVPEFSRVRTEKTLVAALSCSCKRCLLGRRGLLFYLRMDVAAAVYLISSRAAVVTTWKRNGKIVRYQKQPDLRLSNCQFLHWHVVPVASTLFFEHAASYDINVISKLAIFLDVLSLCVYLRPTDVTWSGGVFFISVVRIRLLFLWNVPASLSTGNVSHSHLSSTLRPIIIKMCASWSTRAWNLWKFVT